MQFQNVLLASLLPWLGATLAGAEPLTSATVTEMKNDVRYKPGSAEERTAKLADVIKGSDALRTGERSLAEIEFNDQTLTRLGSMSVFTFDGDKREFRLSRGLTLICAPKGTGGGKIVTAAITAAIEGTTVLAEQFMVAGKKQGDPTRPAGKFIFLEGKGIVSTPDGKQQKKIRGGQMIAHALGDPKLADPQDIDLGTLVAGSGIINGFARLLPTWDAIQDEIERQRIDLRRGVLEETRYVVLGRGAKVGKRQPGQPAGYIEVHDPTYRDSGGIVALSTQAPCNCQ